MPYISNFTDAWANSAQTYTSIGVDITDGGSANSSNIVNYRVNSNTKFAVSKSGGIYSANLDATYENLRINTIYDFANTLNVTISSSNVASVFLLANTNQSGLAANALIITAAFAQGNATYANVSTLQTDVASAYDQANTAIASSSAGSAAFDLANTNQTNISSNSAILTAAFAQGNTNTITLSSAYGQSNTNQTALAANAVILTAAFAQANTNQTALAANAVILTAAFGVANSSSVTAINAFDAANTNAADIVLADGKAAAAFDQANNSSGGAAFDAANAASALASAAFDQGNTTVITVASAYGQSNTNATTVAAAFGQSNTTTITASAAFDQANSVTTTLTAAFGKANTNATNISTLQAQTSLTSPIIHADNYADLKTAVTAMTNNTTLLLQGGATYDVTGQITSWPSNFTIKSDSDRPAIINFAGNSVYYNNGLIQVNGSIHTANSMTQDLHYADEMYKVASGTRTGTTATLTLTKEHTIEVGDFIFVKCSANVDSTIQQSYLTMIDSNEGMALHYPVEVSAVGTYTVSYTFPYGRSDPGGDLSLSSVYVYKNDQCVFLADTSFYAVGDVVELKSNEEFIGFNGGVILDHSELNKVAYIFDSTKMMLREPVRRRYEVGTYSATCAKVIPVRYTMENLTIIGTGGYNNNTNYAQADMGLSTMYAVDSVRKNVTIKDCDYIAAVDIAALDCLVEDCDVYFDLYNSGGRASGFIEIQYGHTYANRCRNLTYNRCRAFGGRHGFVESCLGGWGGGLAVNIKQIDCDAFDQWSNGFSTHDMVDGIEMIRPRAVNNPGINIRTPNVRILDFSAENCEYGVYAYGEINDVYIRAAHLKNVGQGVYVNPAVYASIYAGGSGYSVSDVLTVSGGSYKTQPTTLTVTSVSGGAVTGFTVSQVGDYTVYPGYPTSVTGGGGTGAQFRLRAYRTEYCESTGDIQAVCNNIVIENIENTDSTATAGILVYPRDGVVFKDWRISNTFVKNTQYYGIYLAGSSGLTYAYERFSIINSKFKDLGANYYGLYADALYRSTVQGVFMEQAGSFTVVRIRNLGNVTSSKNKFIDIDGNSTNGGTVTRMDIPSTTEGDYDSTRTLGYLKPLTGYYSKPNASYDRSPSSATLSAGYVYFAGVFYIDRPITISKFQIVVATSASNTIRLGVAKFNIDAYRPQEIAIDAGTVSITSTGEKTITLGSPVTLEPGWYCEVVLADTGGGNPVLAQHYSTQSTMLVGSGTSNYGVWGWYSATGSKDADTAFSANTFSAYSPTIQTASGASFYNFINFTWTT